MDTEFLTRNAPIGEHYHAISPDDSLTSANQLTLERFSSLFEVKIEDTFDDLIPKGDVDDDAPPEGWTDRVNQSLLDSDIDEDRMNVMLQRALKEGGRGLSGLEADEDAAKVSERYIRNLFEDCYGESIKDQTFNGLPITLQSRPDFAVWEGMMLSCEGKHADRYDLEDSIRQSASYALVHLYYWLVKQSFLVNAVYGVAVAGTRCNDMDTGVQFRVVLLRISLPNKIGGKLLLHKYTITEARSLKDLWTFASRVCRLDPTQSPRVQHGQECPALLTMPHELLLNTPVRSTWNMIRNGTAALVLRINESDGWDCIKPYLDKSVEDWEVAKSVERQKVAIEGRIEYPCFLKCKNYLSTNNPKNADFYLVSQRKKSSLLVDLLDAYKVAPISTYCGMYILMADMGIAINESTGFQALDAPRLAFKLYEFMDKVLGCQEACGIVHGDIHIGNLVYDEARTIFCLIDYDEANCGSITRRTPRTPEQQRVHNHELLDEPAAFTKNQLINLFWVCWTFRTDLPPILQPVMHKYDTAYGGGNRPNAGTVNQIYDELCEALKIYNEGNWVNVTIDGLVERTRSLVLGPFSPRKTRTGRVYGVQ